MVDIVRYDPWSLLDDWDDIFSRSFQPLIKGEGKTPSYSMQWKPSVDIKSEDKRYVIFVDIPGVDPDKINIKLEQNALVIEGERHTESKENKEGYSRIERFSGNFYRRFTLPDDADGEHIAAHSKQGVLEIEIPKKKQSVSKKIAIKDIEKNK